MAKTTKKETLDKKNESKTEKIKYGNLSKQQKFVLGCLLILFSVALLVAFISFYVNGQWQSDQSAVSQLGDRTEIVENWLGKFGAYLADLIVYRGFGIASFVFVRLFFLTGMFLALELSTQKLKNTWFWDIFAIIIVLAWITLRR